MIPKDLDSLQQKKETTFLYTLVLENGMELKEGDEVSFDEVEGNRGKSANNIKLL